ncbi:MAG: hypothetical protein RSA20_05735 [Oscillospiraceae bacterium]
MRDFCTLQLNTLWDEIKRLEYPHQYYVDYSQKLWDEQRRLLEERS